MKQTKIIDGKAYAKQLHTKITAQTAELKKQGITPGLAVVLVGNDPASEVYVRNKGKQATSAGFKSVEYKLPSDTRQEELLVLIEQLNNDATINGILVQLPLPHHIDEKIVINAIDATKDVDGFSYVNSGKLSVGEKSLVPCTPLGCIMLLKDYFDVANNDGDLSGKHAVVVGRSNIVGKPMATLLLQENATVTVVHSKTKNIKEICRTADIIVVAVGKAQLINANWINENCVIIDVGINRIQYTDKNSEKKYKLVGDVDFDNVQGVAKAITPVPGGVGPMTIACLLHNTLLATKMQLGIE